MKVNSYMNLLYLKKLNESQNKLILIYIIASILLGGCGKRTTATEYHRFEVDSIAQEKARVIDYNVRFNDIGKLRPVDVSKPIIYNGIEYYNAIITFDKSIIESSKIEDKQKDLSYSSSEVVKDKKTDSKNSNLLWLGLGSVLLGFIFLLIYLPKLK